MTLLAHVAVISDHHPRESSDAVSSNIILSRVFVVLQPDRHHDLYKGLLDQILCHLLLTCYLLFMSLG